MTSPTISVVPNGPMLYIISQLNRKDLCNIAQVSRRFNTLTDQHRDYYYNKDNFETLMFKVPLTDIVGIRWLIKHHPERKCPPGILDWASKYGYTEIVKLLLAANKSCTVDALNWASENGHTEIVKLLLIANKQCTTDALDWASLRGHTKVVKLLLAANKTCTEIALDSASANRYTKIVKLLVEVNKCRFSSNWNSRLCQSYY